MPHLYPENQTYGIINTSDLASVDFTQVMPNQSDEVRYSLDGLMFVIKWEEDHEPTFITDGTIVPVSILSHSDCLTLMQTTEWTEPIPVE
jgi:hypothetical protein